MAYKVVAYIVLYSSGQYSYGLMKPEIQTPRSIHVSIHMRCQITCLGTCACAMCISIRMSMCMPPLMEYTHA